MKLFKLIRIAYLDDLDADPRVERVVRNNNWIPATVDGEWNKFFGDKSSITVSCTVGIFGNEGMLEIFPGQNRFDSMSFERCLMFYNTKYDTMFFVREDTAPSIASRPDIIEKAMEFINEEFETNGSVNRKNIRLKKTKNGETTYEDI